MSAQDFPSTTLSMIQQGQDPKDLVIQHCKPQCNFWEQKLRRCEAKLKELVNADPEMSCMYPLRDWVTCVEGCVNDYEILLLYNLKLLDSLQVLAKAEFSEKHYRIFSSYQKQRGMQQQQKRNKKQQVRLRD